ncbi:MAG: nucleotide pyrophosphohydrolase [Candidatus Lokiarchaeota archaeon]|nr:nucleotide pyrophosphohydrolase [Candidatus Lokiarchaeota archaeon]
MSYNSTLKDFQQKIDAWIIKNGGYWPPLAMLAAIIEEIGELAREINNIEGFKPLKPLEKGNIGEELGDLLYAIACLSNYYQIDLEEKLNKTISKYSIRDASRFS